MGPWSPVVGGKVGPDQWASRLITPDCCWCSQNFPWLLVALWIKLKFLNLAFETLYDPSISYVGLISPNRRVEVIH